MKERLKKARWQTTPSTSGSATASMEMSLPVQSTPTLPTSRLSPQAVRVTASAAVMARAAKRFIGVSQCCGPQMAPPLPRRKTSAGVFTQIAFEQADQQGKRDGHGEIEESHDIVGFEEQEGPRGIDLAELSDVLDPKGRNQRRILDHRNEVIGQRRQDRAQGLGEGNEPEALPAGQAERTGGFELAPIDRFDAGAENLGDEGGVTDRQRHDGPPDEIELADGHHGIEGLQQPVHRTHHGGRADKGDVEQEDQYRNAPDDLDIEGGQLAQQAVARGARQGDQQPDQGGNEEGDESNPDGGE